MVIRLTRYGVPIFLLLGLLGGTLSVINAVREVGQPFIGLVIVPNEQRGMIVANETPVWWSGRATEALPDNVVITAINGQPVTLHNFESIIKTAYDLGEQDVTAVVSRDDELWTLKLPISLITPIHILDFKLVDWLTGLGLWLLAFIVYRARPLVSLNRVFVLACACMAINRWMHIMTFYPQADLLSFFSDFIYIITVYPLLGPSAIHLALLFPKESRLNGFPLRAFIYGLGLFGTILYLSIKPAFWIRDELSTLQRLISASGFQIAVGLILIGFFFITARLLLVLLLKNYSRRERRQAAIFILGMLVGSIYILPILISYLVRRDIPTFWFNLDLRWLLLTVPASLGLIILRYQTFRPANRLFIIVPIIGFSGLLASVMGVIWQSATQETVRPPFIPLLTVAFVASLVWSSQVRWQGFLGRLVNWEKRSYSAVDRFMRQLGGQTDLQTLPHKMAIVLVEEFEIERAAVWLWQENNNSFILVGQAGEWTSPPPSQFKISNQDIFLSGEAIRIHQPGLPEHEWLIQGFNQVEVILPLVAAGQAVGLLALGKRWDEEILDERDIEIVEMVSLQAALFLLTAIQIDELKRVPHMVDEAQERERSKIAQELHDTIQQFLGRLPFSLEVSRQAIIDNPPLSDEILQQTILEVEEAARIVRQIRNDLTTEQLEGGLIQPITSLVEQFRSRNQIDTELDITSEIDLILPTHSRHALFRVVQQALDNIVEHAEAKKVSVAIYYKNKRVLFDIRDNGRGSSITQRLQAQEEGSIGLKYMEARIRNLQGQFEFQSEPDCGTKITGWLPVQIDD